MSTIVLTTPEELRAIISEEVRQAIATATRTQQEDKSGANHDL